MKKRFESLDTDKLIEETFVQSEPELADKNIEQMFSGVRKDGSEISPPYRPLTIFIKKQKGQPTDRVTLADTLSFYEGVNVKTTGDKLIFNSTDEKTVKLQKKYGKDIFGLGGEFKKDVLNETIKPTLKNKIELATGLKFK